MPKISVNHERDEIMRKEEYFIGLETMGRGQGYQGKKRKRRRRRLNGNGKKVIIIAVSLVILALLVAGGIFLGAKMCSEPDADPTSPTGTTAGETTPDETVVTTAPATTAPTEPKDVITQFDAEDDGSKAAVYTDTIFLYKNTGYNLFGSNEKIAKHYASSINKAVKGLDKDITVYNIVVPNHTEYGVPQKIITDLGGSSQAENIKTINNNLDERIIQVNTYNILAQHSDEYIYFNTDHHWTGLGAYYGYVAFCEEAGLTPMDIKSAKKNSVAGFTGTFTSTIPSLANTPDTVDYYSLPVDTYAYLTERGSNETLTVDTYYPGATAGTYSYGVFCWGDVAEFIIHSNAGTGKKVALVKDSYGNAFAPYLAANYDEVHLIDFRYWNGDNFKSYLKQNGITEVIILNNTMSANSPTQVDTLADLLS